MIGTYHNIFRVGALLQDLGFWILNDIVWRKANPMPNFQGHAFHQRPRDPDVVRARSRCRYTFNYEAHEGGERRFADAQRLVPADLRRRRAAQGPERQEAASHPEARGTAGPRDPVAATKPGDIVLDPFLGTGTSAAVAKRLGRRWIGLERDEAYACAAEARIEAVRPITDPTLLAPASKREPSRAFRSAGWWNAA